MDRLRRGISLKASKLHGDNDWVLGLSFVAHRGAELLPFKFYDFDRGELSLANLVFVLSRLPVDCLRRGISLKASKLHGDS